MKFINLPFQREILSSTTKRTNFCSTNPSNCVNIISYKQKKLFRETVLPLSWSIASAMLIEVKNFFLRYLLLGQRMPNEITANITIIIIDSKMQDCLCVIRYYQKTISRSQRICTYFNDTVIQRSITQHEVIQLSTSFLSAILFLLIH